MTRAERVRRADPHRHFLTHCAVMPGWHKAVIILAAFAAVAGLAGVVAARAGADAHVQFIGKSHSAANNAAGAADRRPAEDPGQRVGSLSRASLPAMMVGASVLAGFIGGWYLRAYLVPVMTLLLLAGAGVWAMVHFGMIHGGAGNSAPGSSGGSFEWFAQFGLHAKNAVLGHLPTASSGTFAAFLGFRRW